MGSGKSEFLNAAIAGLIHGNRPETLRLVLIDPKRVGFRRWRESAYLLEPILHHQEPATAAFERLVEEMDDRYQSMEQIGAEDWAHYMRRVSKPTPRIVCVCEEYADLLAGDRVQRKSIEGLITRLGSKARAAGLQMARDIESRMLLGSSGAENLLGQGDLLFKDLLEPVRLQGLWLDTGR